ncbi:MAG: hypothetical protein PHR20_05870 [Bacteroidales bacterium]|nr:hypothetical protein [Bacteroidales bacterium]
MRRHFLCLLFLCLAGITFTQEIPQDTVFFINIYANDQTISAQCSTDYSSIVKEFDNHVILHSISNFYDKKKIVSATLPGWVRFVGFMDASDNYYGELSISQILNKDSIDLVKFQRGYLIYDDGTVQPCVNFTLDLTNKTAVDTDFLTGTWKEFEGTGQATKHRITFFTNKSGFEKNTIEHVSYAQPRNSGYYDTPYLGNSYERHFQTTGGYFFKVLGHCKNYFAWEYSEPTLTIRHSKSTSYETEVIPNTHCDNCEESFAILWAENVRQDVLYNEDVKNVKSQINETIKSWSYKDVSIDFHIYSLGKDFLVMISGDTSDVNNYHVFRREKSGKQ